MSTGRLHVGPYRVTLFVGERPLIGWGLRCWARGSWWLCFRWGWLAYRWWPKG